MSQAYPLAWPPGWPRTEPSRREVSKFKTTVHGALSFLEDEVRRLGGKQLVISSNCSLGQSRPADPGVCAYFHYQGINAAIPCDRWRTPEDNLHAIAKTIEAMRGIERWGAKNMIKAAFTGFAALPAPGHTSGRGWRDVLELPESDFPVLDKSMVEKKYRTLAQKKHPDKGGDAQAFHELTVARDQAIESLGA